MAWLMCNNKTTSNQLQQRAWKLQTLDITKQKYQVFNLVSTKNMPTYTYSIESTTHHCAKFLARSRCKKISTLISSNSRPETWYDRQVPKGLKGNGCTQERLIPFLPLSLRSASATYRYATPGYPNYYHYYYHC